MGPPPGVFGGGLYGATNRVRGVPKSGGHSMRTLPLGPSVEIPMGPRTVRRVCRNGAGTACGPSSWGLRLSSLWDQEPCEGAPKGGGHRMRALPMGPSLELPLGPRGAPKCGSTACEPSRRGRRRSALWGHEPREGRAEMGSAPPKEEEDEEEEEKKEGESKTHKKGRRSGLPAAPSTCSNPQWQANMVQNILKLCRAL